MTPPGSPKGRLRRLAGCAGLVAGCVAVATGAAGAGPAGAQPIQSCTSSSGVLVAVDFGHWGGPVDLGCGPSTGTGYDAMTAGGFITAGTQSDGPAFICRIGLASQGTQSFEPTPSEDPCVNTPPLSASWSYWHAAPGQNSWSYSQVGAMSYRPPAGSVDAWTFGATNPSGSTGAPPFSPEQVRAAASSGGSAGFVPASPAPATTAATAPPTTSPAATATTAGTGPQPGAPTAAATGTAPTASPATGPAATGTAATGTAATAGPSAATAPTSSTTGVSTPTTDGGGAAVQAPGVAPTSTAPGRPSTAGVRIVASPAGGRGSSGPPAASIAGLSVVALAAGAAGVVAWRRRRAG